MKIIGRNDILEIERQIMEEKMNDSSLERDGKEISVFHRMKLFLIALSLVFVPLIMRIYLYDPKLSEYPWFSDSNFEADIFLHYKGKVFVFLAGMMLLVLVYDILKNREKIAKEYWILFLIGYACFSTLSTFLSPYLYFGLHGSYEQHETLWVLLAYGIVTFYSFFYVRDEKSTRFVIISLLILGVILSFIGLTQLLGKDFFETEFAKALMIPSHIEEEYGFRETLQFSFSGSGNHQVYLTMYNPNYVGPFVALVFPIFVSMSVAAKKTGMKLVWAGIAGIHFLAAMGSGSKTFLGSFLISGLFSVLIYRKKLKKGWKFVLIAFLLLVIVTVGYFHSINTNMITYVKNALSTKENENRVGGIEFFKDRAEFTYNQDNISISFARNPKEEGNLTFRGGQGEIISYEQTEEDGIVLEREAFKEIRFYLVPDDSGERNVVVGLLPEGRIAIVNTEEGYRYMTNMGKEDKIDYPPTAIIKNHDAFASGRGYIWSRTFPLMGKHWFLGSGADSFTLAFPQKDYIGKLNGGFGNMIITKPHNIYMQIWVQTGFLSLLCYFMLALIYLVRSFRYYVKQDVDTVEKFFGAGISLGMIGYLTSGVFNDSVVAVAPIYWVLLGVGYGIQYFLQKQQEKNLEEINE